MCQTYVSGLPAAGPALAVPGVAGAPGGQAHRGPLRQPCPPPIRLPIPYVTAMAIPPSRNWRAPERSTGRPVSRPTTIPPVTSATAVMTRVAARLGRPSQVREQRYQRPERERAQGGEARQKGRGQLARIDAEFLPGVHPQGRARVLGHRGGHPGRRLGVRPVLAEVARQFLLLGHGEQSEHLLFQRHLGVHQLVLVGDRDVLAGAHRERPRHQRGHAGQHDRVRRRLAPAQPGDQGGVGDQPVHRAEDGRPQPAAGHVTVPVRPSRAQRRRPGLRRRPAYLLVSHVRSSPPGRGPSGACHGRSIRCACHGTAGSRRPAGSGPVPALYTSVSELVGSLASCWRAPRSRQEALF